MSNDITPRLRESLVRLGLSESEMKAYIELLGGGPLTAMDVSRRAGIPYSKIYDVLRRLEEKGWIIVEESNRPAIFIARHPREAIEIWKSRRELDLRKYEEEALDELGRIAPSALHERHDVWISRGFGAIVADVAEAIRKCEEEVFVAIPQDLEDEMERIAGAIAGSSGDDIKVLAPNKAGADVIKEAAPRALIRVKEGMFGGGVICGASSVVLLLGEKSTGEPYVAIRAEHPGLSLIARSYFEHLWDQAEPEQM